MELSRRELIAVCTAGIALSNASSASTKAVPVYPGPASIGHRVIDANGLKVHVAEQGSGPLVLLCHGFPESWYSWRNQIPALAAAGYHAVAPDMRGYGGTDAPPERDSYTIMDLVGDMVGGTHRIAKSIDESLSLAKARWTARSTQTTFRRG